MTAQTEAAVTGGENLVRLQDALEIQQVESVRELLLPMLLQGDTAVVDLGGVTSIDTAGVQLLLSLGAEAPRCGVVLEFRDVPAIVGDALKTLGLSSLAAAATAHGA